ncbi:MAG: outer membrane protein assembly factor [Desulfonatronovibrio sp. MSAO_Bac4]|nr:MAG: outer membrane protein assembly factor [Desulfonatronovibrio sp. MSAO_Bac4]
MSLKNKIFLALLLILTPTLTMAQEIIPIDQEPPPGAIRYEVTLSGEVESQILQSLTYISDTISLKNRPPMTMAQLKRRIREDISEFTKALRSFGYYASEVGYTIDTETEPVKIDFQIKPGPPYLITQVTITSICPDMDPDTPMPSPQTLGLEKGQRIRSSKVMDAMDIIIRDFRSKGYPFPIVEISEVIIDHREHSASIHYTLDPGPWAMLGEVSTEGLDRVKPQYIHERIPWETGDEFKTSKINQFRRQLTVGGLFSMVEINHPDELEDDNTLPVRVKVTERKPRTVRAGIGFETDIGPELRLGWTHRNLKGMGETLEFDLRLSDPLKHVEGRYTIPSFLRRDQKLTLKTGVTQEKQDAFDSESVYVSSMLERSLSDRLSVGAGVGYRIGRVKQFGESKDLGLVYFPTDLTWDGRDDILNPGTGISFNLKVIPFFDTLDSKSKFVKTYSSLNTYLELLSEKRIVLANRTALGTINAQSKSHVPPDERFYAGGGGSVRGYSYQTAGELEDGKPVGGLSLAEINNELRFRVSKHSGFVLFLDGGRAFDSSYPDFDQKLYWGWGLGYRFFTDFGPIRADIAFPVNPRDEHDSSFQVYISIGQAF